MNRHEKVWYDEFDNLGCLGQGGNGDTFRVVEKKSGKEFALKELREKSKEKKRRFVREVDLVSEFSSCIEGIIPIYKYSKENFWYTMPIAIPIDKYIQKGNKEVDDIVSGIIQVAETLCKLHLNGISHRDVKPFNIYFFDNQYYIGDLGLAGDERNLDDDTKSDRALGAIFTMAPEMKRNPKVADGKKADVFSLAKTLWMLLTGDTKGFDGVYNPSDQSYGLKYISKFKGMHLVELEDLLKSATNNDPETRPTMLEFKESLSEWLVIKKDFEKSQLSDWKAINKHLFGTNKVESVVWKDLQSIINTMNVLGESPVFNHMLFSEGGGQDFTRVTKANELGCIYLYDDSGTASVIKPKALYYETFGNRYSWNYFLLEATPLNSILGDTTEEGYERLVEDKSNPVHYVSAADAQYGVYDYDSGDKLPDGYKVVYRYTTGKFLMVLKNGPYNQISGTYDGRHGMCNECEFRKYIESLADVTERLEQQGYKKEEILRLKYFDINPFEKKTSVGRDIKEKEDIDEVASFIINNYEEWNFKEIFVAKDCTHDLAYEFEFYKDSNFQLNRYFINVDGFIELNTGKTKNYVVYSRSSAIEFLQRLEAFLEKKFKAGGMVSTQFKSYFRPVLRKVRKPQHLFNLEEVKGAMRGADDRVNNTLVIDENGYVSIIKRNENVDLYPVRLETWIAGNNYVGKYSNLITADETYTACLSGWLDFLKSGKDSFVDYFYTEYSNEQLVSMINKYY